MNDTSIPVDRTSRAERASAVFPTLLGMATVASTATKFRMADLSFGIGEFLLVTWLGLSIFARASSTGFAWRPTLALRWGGPFVLATGCALVVGSIAAQVAGVTGSYGTVHEAMAWIFVVALVGWFLLESGPPSEVARFLHWFAALGTLSSALLLMTGVVSRLVWGMDALWYGGIRLSGWSENPNQLAILLAPLPFLALHFLKSAVGWSALAWRVGIICTIVAGVATLSDALLLAWAVGACVLGLEKWIRAALGRQRTVGSVAFSAVALPAVLGGVLVLFGPTLTAIAGALVEARVNEGGQAAVRFELWRHGLEAALQSPVFGWGPGAHSGIRTAFEGVESHNTAIDFAAQAGLPAAIALASLVALAIALAVRSNARLLAFAVAVTVSVALFHNMLRHPIFWFLIFGVMAACTQRNETAPKRERKVS